MFWLLEGCRKGIIKFLKYRIFSQKGADVYAKEKDFSAKLVSFCLHVDKYEPHGGSHPFL